MSAGSPKSTKKRIFEIIQIGNFEDTPSRTFDVVLVAVIVLNILVMILQTFDSLDRFDGVFYGIELVTILFFCVEYVLRIWTAEFLFPDSTRAQAVLKFLFSYDGVVELLTILPFFFLSGFVALRMLRVVRIFHLFRINATYDSFNVIRTVIYEKRNQLASSIFIILILILAASITMYNVEHQAQPEAFSNALSGIWWSVSALLTIGYGDIYPVTIVGRILAVVISFLGVGAVALPTGIISAGFVEQYTKVALGPETSELPQVQNVIVDIDSAWIGKSALELAGEFHIVVIFVRRKRRSFIPDAEYNVQLGDGLTICPVPDGVKV